MELVLGCANGRFGGGNFKVKHNVNDNIIIVIGVAASYSSLLGWIQSGSCTSDLILLQQGEYKYNNNALQLDLNTDRGGGGRTGGTLESDIKNNGGGIRLCISSPL